MTDAMKKKTMKRFYRTMKPKEINKLVCYRWSQLNKSCHSQNDNNISFLTDLRCQGSLNSILKTNYISMTDYYSLSEIIKMSSNRFELRNYTSNTWNTHTLGSELSVQGV